MLCATVNAVTVATRRPTPFTSKQQREHEQQMIDAEQDVLDAEHEIRAHDLERARLLGDRTA